MLSAVPASLTVAPSDFQIICRFRLIRSLDSDVFINIDLAIKRSQKSEVLVTRVALKTTSYN